ncbi:hypothetical protein BH10BDE1_BH10BDE1_26000 [soil metagenome]
MLQPDEKVSKEIRKRGQPRGNSLSILLLVFPIAGLYWIINSGVTMPANHVALIKEGGAGTAMAFAVLWWISFCKAERDRNLIAASLFLFVMWMVSGVFVFAKINTEFDKGAGIDTLARVTAVYKIAGSRDSTGCSLTLDSEIAGTNVIHVRRTYCDGLRPGTDGIRVQLRPGYFFLPWFEDISIVLDFDQYRERLHL